jgi:hypothetical protein
MLGTVLSLHVFAFGLRLINASVTLGTVCEADESSRAKVSELYTTTPILWHPYLTIHNRTRWVCRLPIMPPPVAPMPSLYQLDRDRTFRLEYLYRMLSHAVAPIQRILINQVLLIDWGICCSLRYMTLHHSIFHRTC